MAARLASLGNPIRLRMIRTLVRAGDAGVPVGELQRRLGLAASTHAHHLAALVNSGLVPQERNCIARLGTAELEHDGLQTCRIRNSVARRMERARSGRCSGGLS